MTYKIRNLCSLCGKEIESKLVVDTIINKEHITIYECKYCRGINTKYYKKIFNLSNCPIAGSF